MSSEADFREFWDDILPPYVPPPKPEGRAWLALFTESGEEVSGLGYKRVRYDYDFPGPGGSVTFPVAEGNWGTISHFVLYDAPEGGEQIFPPFTASAKLNVSRDITVNATISIEDV